MPLASPPVGINNAIGDRRGHDANGWQHERQHGGRFYVFVQDATGDCTLAERDRGRGDDGACVWERVTQRLLLALQNAREGALELARLTTVRSQQQTEVGARWWLRTERRGESKAFGESLAEHTGQARTNVRLEEVCSHERGTASDIASEFCDRGWILQSRH
eukprot:3982846-Prymnesium_polylepis.1